MGSAFPFVSPSVQTFSTLPDPRFETQVGASMGLNEEQYETIPEESQSDFYISPRVRKMLRQSKRDHRYMTTIEFMKMREPFKMTESRIKDVIRKDSEITRRVVFIFLRMTGSCICFVHAKGAPISHPMKHSMFAEMLRCLNSVQGLLTGTRGALNVTDRIARSQLSRFPSSLAPEMHSARRLFEIPAGRSGGCSESHRVRE